MIEKWIFEVSHGDSVPLEKPFLELLNEGCFERGDVLVQFNDFSAECLDLLELYLVVSLADFLLLDKLELLLVDDILGEFFLGLALFLETNFVADLLKLILLALHLVRLHLDCLFFDFEFLDIAEYAIVELLPCC